MAGSVRIFAKVVKTCSFHDRGWGASPQRGTADLLFFISVILLERRTSLYFRFVGPKGSRSIRRYQGKVFRDLLFVQA